jgi:hypothetical protein
VLMLRGHYDDAGERYQRARAAAEGNVARARIDGNIGELTLKKNDVILLVLEGDDPYTVGAFAHDEFSGAISPDSRISPGLFDARSGYVTISFGLVSSRHSLRRDVLAYPQRTRRPMGTRPVSAFLWRRPLRRIPL